MNSKAAGVRGVAAYKKKDGTLSISKDQRSVVWVPSKASEVVTIAIADIASTCCGTSDGSSVDIF